MKANLNQALMTAARWILEGPQSARRFRNSLPEARIRERASEFLVVEHVE